LVDRDDVNMLVAGAYNGRELWVSVPESLHDDVIAFISDKANVASDALENAETEVKNG